VNGAEGPHRTGDDLVQGQLLKFQGSGPAVDPCDLEQVLDHLREATGLAAEQLQRLSAFDGEAGPEGGKNLDRGLQGSERRAQLMADVGGEADIALDTAGQGVDHAVEGGDQRGQVCITISRKSLIEGSLGDGAGHRGHAGEGPDQARARPAPDDDTAHGGGQRGSREHGGQQAQCGRQLAQRFDLEVVGPDRRQGKSRFSWPGGPGSIAAPGWPAPSRP